MEIKQKILDYKKELDYFEDTMEKYKYLLDQGKKAKPFPEEYRHENFLVKGCQAQVWLVPKFEKGLVVFFSDSDAFISKGMVTILTDIYSNRTPKEILNSDINQLKILGLENILTPTRRNGVYAMLKYIKKYAENFLVN